MSDKIKNFVVENWVSWVIEVSILSVVAYFTIAETPKTAEQTREMLARYDAVISKFAVDKSEAIEDAVILGVDTAKEKAKSISVDDVKDLVGVDEKEDASKE